MNRDKLSFLGGGDLTRDSSVEMLGDASVLCLRVHVVCVA
jgi:hypothetical protein